MDNKIKAIPDKIVNSAIRELGLTRNMIEVVPNFMDRVRLSPGFLYLQGNPIKQVHHYAKIKDKFSA